MSALLEIDQLCVHYPLSSGLLRREQGCVRAVDGVSLTVKRGTTVGLVGESGSGKTTLGRSIVRLAPVTSGVIRYDGVDLASLNAAAFFPYRKRIQMIFQDPFNSLNPRMRCRDIIAEPMDIHFKERTAQQKRDRVASLLEKVGLLPDHMERFPHEFSGGQRQRIGIARALAAEPDFIICDEPVSALDVSVQAQIVNLLKDLQEELGLTYLFIAHDLAVVEHMSDMIAVMTGGKIVELAPAETLCATPSHPYTQRLLSAVPKL